MFSLQVIANSILAKLLMHSIIRPLESTENKLAYFLDRFPEYRKTLGLAVAHEESGNASRAYRGWQWHDVETHPTKLIRLVTEGISRINLKTRDATAYVLRDREAVKRVLGVVLSATLVETLSSSRVQ